MMSKSTLQQSAKERALDAKNKRLRYTIRFAKRPDDPQLLLQYLKLPFPKGWPPSRQREYHTAQFRLLMDTLADEHLPAHWRCLCLDHLYIPLQALQNIASCAESQRHLNALYRELQIISHYYQAGLTGPVPLTSIDEILNND